MRVGDDEQAVAQVVEHEQCVREHEHGVRQSLVVVRRGGQPFHMSDHVVPEEPDGAALEAGQPGHGDRLELVEQAAQRFQRVAVRQPLGTALASEGDAPVLTGEDHEGVAAEE